MIKFDILIRLSVKPWMFSEGYKSGVCLDDFDVGLDWNALII